MFSRGCLVGHVDAFGLRWEKETQRTCRTFDVEGTFESKWTFDFGTVQAIRSEWPLSRILRYIWFSRSDLMLTTSRGKKRWHEGHLGNLGLYCSWHLPGESPGLVLIRLANWEMLEAILDLDTRHLESHHFAFVIFVFVFYVNVVVVVMTSKWTPRQSGTIQQWDELLSQETSLSWK